MSMGWTMGTLACLLGMKGALAAARAAALAGVWRPKAEAPVAKMQKAAVNFMVVEKWRIRAEMTWHDNLPISRSLCDGQTVVHMTCSTTLQPDAHCNILYMMFVISAPGHAMS